MSNNELISYAKGFSVTKSMLVYETKYSYMTKQHSKDASKM